MDFQNKNKPNYDRVMSRVFNRSRSSLRSSSNVTRHEVPSSVRVGAKPSASAVSSSVFSELPTVLNDYVPEVNIEKVVKRPVVRPRRTLKSLDPGKAKSPSRPSRARGRDHFSNIRARSSVPVSSNTGEEWAESHVRQCYSSRSHTKLKELKDEIKAFRETDKLLKMRSHLYKSCGVVLDDVGNIAQDKAVQAELQPDKGHTSSRVREWLILLGREDLLEKDLKKFTRCVCSAHFHPSSIVTIQRLQENAVPTLLLANQPNTTSSKAQPTSAQFKDTTTVLSKSTKGVASCSALASGSAQIKDKGKVILTSEKMLKKNIETQTNNQELLSAKQIQTSKLLTEVTPRKRKLSRELNEFKFKQRKLSSEITKIKQELEIKNKPITCNDPDEEITRRFKKLIEWQNKIKNKFKGNRYDAEYKLFALNLHFSSPQTYRCLQTILKLPSKSTLNRFKINIPSKLDNRALDALTLKIKSLPDEAKYCTICVDEMTLKRNLYYNIHSDEVIGFHNINGKISPEIASNAVVIMLQGIYFKWKQPLAYALLATAKHYEEIDDWMNEVISKLSAIGIKVKAIVSDQDSNFDKFAKEVKKVTLDKPYFVYDSTKIYFVLDVPHLVKCIRNNLLASDFIVDGKKISWKYIVQLYEDQKDKNLRLIPKITEAHIHPNNFQKMSVKLAVQTLSRTVSAALNTYIDLGKISEEARPTAAFIESMNTLFDILNSSKIKCNNKFQTAFRLSNDQKTVLDAAKEMFAGIKAINKKNGKNKTGHIKCCVNFQISIQSIIMLYEDLEKDGFKYLLTRRLNQDNLEKKIGFVRQQGGSCSEPTPIQFQRAFSKLFIYNMMKNAPYGNCELDICDLLVKAEDMMKIKLTGNDLPPQTSAIGLGGETDYRIDLPDENTLTYVSGYLFFKCVNNHNCPAIDEISKSVPGLDQTNLFGRYKAYNKNSGFYGSLKMPPKEFIEYVQNLETIFTENFEKLVQDNPGSKLLQLFQSISAQTPCSCFPVNYLLKLFARFRIYATIKFNNRQFKDGKKGIKKYLKVSHL